MCIENYCLLVFGGEGVKDLHHWKAIIDRLGLYELAFLDHFCITTACVRRRWPFAENMSRFAGPGRSLNKFKRKNFCLSVFAAPHEWITRPVQKAVRILPFSLFRWFNTLTRTKSLTSCVRFLRCRSYLSQG
jgi:hypothetical protein